MFDKDALELVTSANPRLVASVYLTLAALMFGMSVAARLGACPRKENTLLVGRLRRQKSQ
jgi:hypothetical protein